MHTIPRRGAKKIGPRAIPVIRVAESPGGADPRRAYRAAGQKIALIATSGLKAENVSIWWRHHDLAAQITYMENWARWCPSDSRQVVYPFAHFGKIQRPLVIFRPTWKMPILTNLTDIYVLERISVRI